jgi:hypothetical protein
MKGGNGMKKYTIDISEELWRSFKGLCGSLGITLKQAIIQSISQWIDRQKGGEK